MVGGAANTPTAAHASTRVRSQAMTQDESTTRRVWTVSDPGIQPTPINERDRPKPPNPPRSKSRQTKRDKQPGTDGLVDVYIPYSAQWKGKASRWKSRRRKNAKRDKQAQQRIPKVGQARIPVPPSGPSDQFTIDPYYESKEWRELRLATLRRDGHRCRYCGAVAHQADHVIPRRQGGADTLVNLVASCHICNKTAGGRRFITFEAKRRWILGHRDETKTEIRERPPQKPAKDYANEFLVKTKPLGRLRSRLKAKREAEL